MVSNGGTALNLLLIGGTPTNSGTFSFILQVADSTSATAQHMFTIEIQNNAPTITVEGCTNGTIQLRISGDAGPSYTIETSTNLVDWEAVFTTNAPSRPFHWSDPGASTPATFYRAVLSP